VVSRCQRFDFRRIPLSAVVQRLEFIAGQEGFTCATEGLETIARCATGSLRDGINLLEQLVDSFGKELTQEHVREGLDLVVDERSAELAGQALHGQLAEGLGVLAGVRDDGLDLRQFQRHVVAYLRGLLQVKAGAASADAWSEEQLAAMTSLVSDVPPERIVAGLRAFGEADLRADPLSPLPLEIALATCALGGTIAEAPEASRAMSPKVDVRRPVATKTPPAAAQRVESQTTPEPAPNGPREEQADGAEPAVAVAPLSTATGDVGLEEVRALWPEIYQRSREIEHTTGALLNSGCGIIDVSEREVVFGFRHQIHLDKMLADGANNVRALQQAIDEKLGSGRAVRCVLATDVDVQRPAARGGHLVRAAQEMGARVLDEEP
jgi:DNA polymerase-3 subunit gamma/tau